MCWKATLTTTHSIKSNRAAYLSNPSGIHANSANIMIDFMVNSFDHVVGRLRGGVGGKGREEKGEVCAKS